MTAPLIVSVVGTRPEAIKMAPVVRALGKQPEIEQQVFLTGQHGGLESHFDLPDGNLHQLRFNPRDRDVERLRSALRALLCGRFRRRPIDLVLVHGDTTSAAAGALAARDCGIPLAHVEAGLRSFDLDEPWPEESHRVAIDGMADLLFAPTEASAENLKQEPRVTGRILVTGNSGIDALLHARARVPTRAAESGDGRRRVLVTCHRRENQGAPANAVCDTIRRMVAELPVRVAAALHLNPLVRAPIEAKLAGADHVELLEPQGYEPMVGLMDSSWLILTDSGGLQEEAPALGKPVLVLRNVTERPEALASGNLELVGTDPDRIFAAVAGLLGNPEKYARMARPSFPFGDGKASERIAAAIEQWLAQRDRGPTPLPA
jgi:UDP-N-acetylglucosamine 2-epimerase